MSNLKGCHFCLAEEYKTTACLACEMRKPQVYFASMQNAEEWLISKSCREAKARFVSGDEQILVEEILTSSAK